MKWTVILMILSSLYSLGCSVVGVRTAEELQYTVLQSEENFEIREYAPYIAAEASTDEPEDATSSLFRLLAGYIFGKNSTEESIAMTAPVMM